MREKTFKLSGQFISSYPIRKWKQNWLSIGRRWKIEETGYSQKISQFMQKLQSGYRNSPVNSKQKGGRAKHLKGSLEEKNPNKQKRQDIGLSYGNFHTVTNFHWTRIVSTGAVSPIQHPMNQPPRKTEI